MAIFFNFPLNIALGGIDKHFTMMIDFIMQLTASFHKRKSLGLRQFESCNACHIVPLIVRSKKVNHMISVRCCVIEIKDKLRKGH